MTSWHPQVLVINCGSFNYTSGVECVKCPVLSYLVDKEFKGMLNHMAVAKITYYKPHTAGTK